MALIRVTTLRTCPGHAGEGTDVTHTMPNGGLPGDVRVIAAVLAKLRARAPRVQCLTNTVAQPITANALHALGVRASMAVHADEVVEMALSADAVLINLGTPDPVRIAAIDALIVDGRVGAKPLVLDPVFVQASGLRRALAARVLTLGGVIVKGNASEVDALELSRLTAATAPRAVVTTGAMDRISAPDRVALTCGHGHAWMAAVTGLGCALGAVVAACAAVEADPMHAAAAGVAAFAVAGHRAAARATGPGTFAAVFLDELAALDTARLDEVLQ